MREGGREGREESGWVRGTEGGREVRRERRRKRPESRSVDYVSGHIEYCLSFYRSRLQRLVIDKNDPHRFATANRDANKSKNRYVNVLPCES